ncbi:RIO1 family protein, putative [Babesia bigemina]|uniref:Serine/threonine-protein kinase RIO2 n=1 Tax=Babesia bigemina TaxID=5866 RepID=A0A061D9P4_BABBI|nr:RIO1 family protein, putative [Babesia bigemina]CDR97406.1 RIO1 family protein, putative [Babesia bigemina]|eukprot:XP_012769592.1 RIO1 family protein, putative [Babesia bigemina]
MKLDPSHFSHLGNTEFRVLTAIELGMRNHEYIPLKLITATANLRSCGMSNVLASLAKAKLIVHCNESYDGYKLTFLGLDYLALRALLKRGVISAVGRRIGVGKEADVHLCTDAEGNLLVLKLHRLGRVSFRAVKHKRDYMGKRRHASWMYMSQLAAKKEYSYLSALWEENFPVPQPLDINRHVIAMKFVDGVPLSQVREMAEPKRVLHMLMKLIVRLARVGIIHGDFNGFNLMISEDGKQVTVIDFPQVVSVTHEDAEFYFDRDVECVREMFRKKFKMDVFEYPRFADVVPKTDDPNSCGRLKLKVVIDKVDDGILSEILQHLRQEEIVKQAESDPQQISAQMEKLSLKPGDAEKDGDEDDESESDSDYRSSDDDDPAGSPRLSESPGSSEADNAEKCGYDTDDEAEDDNDQDAESSANSSVTEDSTPEDSSDVESDPADGGVEEDEDSSDSGYDTDDERDPGEADGTRAEKSKPIQIWTPHVKRINASAYGHRINTRARNKAKAETKKGHKQRKQLTEANLAVKGGGVW